MEKLIFISFCGFLFSMSLFRFVQIDHIDAKFAELYARQDTACEHAIAALGTINDQRAEAK